MSRYKIATNGERMIRLYPASKFPTIASAAFDDLGREYFVLLVDCEHGQGSAVVVSETKTLADVRFAVGVAALERCALCRGKP